jgi:integrase/recombinase XerD
LKAQRRPPRELSQAEMITLIDACDRLRDKFLLTLLRSTGMFSRAQSPCASVVL